MNEPAVSGAPTIGIEEEFLLIDSASADLVGRAEQVLERAGARLGEGLAAELSRCQVESNTTVCADLDQATAELTRLRAGLSAAAGEVGAALLPLASHPWAQWSDQRPNTDTEHYRELLSTYQQVAREQVICGCHVHVGIDDPDQRITAINSVRPWLAVLLALSANSPWWQGSDTGYASYRTMLWRSWPTTTMPPVMRDYRDYERLVETLRKVEAIDSPAALYWYLRPAATLPTIEFRICDVCLRVDDAVTIAGLARALTVAGQGSGSRDEPPPVAVLDSAVWRAARYGLEGQLVDPLTHTLEPAATVVGHLLDWVAPALEETGDRQRVTAGVSEILGRGNGASVQRRRLRSGAGPLVLLDAEFSSRA